MQDLNRLSKRLEEELRIRIFQIAIHKDEGHYDKDSREWKPNYHAHLVADWQNLETGKTLKHQSFHYSKMQDITAECLEMERGISGSKGRLEAIEFKIQKKEDELVLLNNKIAQIKEELKSKKFADLIVKESDFLGFSRIKTDKTIENYERVFKSYNTELLKNKEILQYYIFQINNGLSQNKNRRNDNYNHFSCYVDPQGFEPQMTEPKSVVLPLHHGSVSMPRNYRIYFKYENQN